MRGLALGGFMGTGKTTVGRILAARQGVPFVDMDAVLTERFGPIPEQFVRDGEEVFRQRERDLLTEVCTGAVQVISTGGGVMATQSNRELLRRHLCVAVLHAPIDTLLARIGSGPGRPLAGQARSLWVSRRDSYAQADAAFRTDGVSADVVADRVEAWWRTQ